jgi:hypothetical protein
MFSVSFPTSLFRRPRLGTLLFKLSSCASQPAEWGVWLFWCKCKELTGIARMPCRNGYERSSVARGFWRNVKTRNK